MNASAVSTSIVFEKCWFVPNSTVSVKSNHRLTVFTFSFGLTFDAFCFGACFTTASSERSTRLQCPTVTLQAVRDLHDVDSTRRVEIKRRPSETSSRSRCLVLAAPEHVVIFISVCGYAIEAGVSSQSRSTAVFPSTFPCAGATDSSPSSSGSDNRASLKASWSDVLVRTWYIGHLAWRAPKPSSRAQATDCITLGNTSTHQRTHLISVADLAQEQYRFKTKVKQLVLRVFSVGLFLSRFSCIPSSPSDLLCDFPLFCVLVTT